MFFGLFHVIPNTHTHTQGFPAQAACRPPSLRPSQGATEVRKCDLNSSSKAAHPCCRRTTALFFLSFCSEYFWKSLLLVGCLDHFAFVRHVVLPVLLWRAIANGMPKKEIRAHRKHICRSLLPGGCGCGCLPSGGNQAKLHGLEFSTDFMSPQ